MQWNTLLDVTDSDAAREIELDTVITQAKTIYK